MTVTHKEVEKDTEATLTCTISGLWTTATIVWRSRKGGPDLKNDENFTLGGTGYVESTKNQQSTLTVKAAVNTADHIYYCTVTSMEWRKVEEENPVHLNVFGMCFINILLSVTHV